MSDDALSLALARFRKQNGSAHAFQVVMRSPYVAADAFAGNDPVVVPARTLLAQLP